MKIAKKILFILLLLTTCDGYCQNLDRTFYLKFEALANQEKSANRLYQRADSIKKTREPVNSDVKLVYDRDVDFGYTHRLINITLNGTYDYHINLLVHDDTICLSSVLYGQGTSIRYNDYDRKSNILRNHPKIDTLKAMQYLKLRNAFYDSAKTIDDLKKELNEHEMFGLYCGDGAYETDEAKLIDSLAKHKQVTKLRAMLVNICSETQAYGIYGYMRLKKYGFKISNKDQRIFDYLINRKTFLYECHGDIAGVFPRDGYIRNKAY
ncbi:MULTISPECIES: hypothetical protein [Mucilaginibacter]|uniref:hypothetical protein n=1 Tax=Mucilaginibacter TaxID=423349 RepID=UPI000871908E|nr:MULTISPECIES: hypothetical protein [Mucilaginibacter]GGA88416.1 hypothetical protein GCM10011500_00020 [Mucilaginibacter rubeus]SCW40973.1 hypothetical protein SAMN03159284_00397 [Mucilaginibacter sp. NFR10]